MSMVLQGCILSPDYFQVVIDCLSVYVHVVHFLGCLAMRSHVLESNLACLPLFQAINLCLFYNVFTLMDKSNNLLQPIAGDQDHSRVPFVVIVLRE